MPFLEGFGRAGVGSWGCDGCVLGFVVRGCYSCYGCLLGDAVEFGFDERRELWWEESGQRVVALC